MTPLIQATDLHKSFGTTQAVDGVSLSIAAGEIYGLVGSDGAGKTTTLRLLVGALNPDQGEASICGYNVHRQEEQARARIGYLSQRFSLYEDLSVLENIRFFAEVRGLLRDEWLPRCMEILDFVGLGNFRDRRAGQLSGGMKQKLGLASALVARPSVLLLDEPTTGVDPVTRQDFWQLLIRIVSLSPNPSPNGKGAGGEGVSVLLTTPYMDEASRCTRVGFMRGGRIIAEGTPPELRATLNGRILEVVPVPARGEVHGKSLPALRANAEKLEGVEDARLFGDKLHLRVRPGRTEAVMADLAGARLVPPTLEDVFIALSETGEAQSRIIP